MEVKASVEVVIEDVLTRTNLNCWAVDRLRGVGVMLGSELRLGSDLRLRLRLRLRLELR